MSTHRYDISKIAYKEAQHRIKEAENETTLELNLSNLGLTAIPPEITQLTNLQWLGLSHNQLTTIPSILTELPSLRTLWLNSNRLTTIPSEITKLTKLKSLDLYNNQLTIIPPEIAQLTKLRSLALGNNQIAAIPPEIAQLTKLQTFWFNNNNLTFIPPEIAQLTELQLLNVGSNQLTFIPPEIAQLTCLRELDLSRNQLTSIPSEIAQLVNLKELDLSSNQLTIIPPEITQLTNLQWLGLGNNKLTTIPSEIILLTSLQWLELSENQITAVIPEITQLTKLRTLNLIDNQITAIPPEIAQLVNLRTLNLSINQLTSIPHEIMQLVNLQSLNLNNNKLTSIPPEIAQLSNLQSLDLSINQLATIPSEINQLSNLIQLNLDFNWLTIIPSEFSQLVNLQTFYLNSNQLTSIPVEISQLINLKTLNLSINDLTFIPSEFAQLINLNSLNFSSNQLTDIPPEFAQLTNLQSLNLNSNQLTAVPPELGQLENLKTLNLNSNQLTDIPPEFNQLINLRWLELGDNKLTSIPEWLVKLPQLERLFVRNNPITQPPPAQLGKALTAWDFVDLKAARRYYVQLAREGESYFYEAKLLLIGEGGAGKTSLARKLLAPLAPLPTEKESTEGIDILQWQFSIPSDNANPSPELTEGKDHSHIDNPDSDPSDLDKFNHQYTANIWDFGGQSVYYATHQFFLSKRSVYILLTDTRRQHTDFYDWLRMQEAFGENSPILLLKNQNRQHGNQCIIENLPYLRYRFPNLKEVIELDLRNIPHESNWDLLLTYLKDHFLSLNHIHVARPKTWIEVRQTIRNSKHDRISFRSFLNLCRVCGITDKADALQLSDYLHDIGDILHFESDPILKDLVVLKPTWALDAVYRVLDNDKITSNWGQFSRQDLRVLWHETTYDYHREQLLRLMQNFKLCYELGNDNFIAPQLLQAEAPNYEWDAEPDDLQLRYRYPVFMPRGILSRAIVTLHTRIESQELVWRTGVILHDKFARAELLELRSEGEIRIRVSGRLKRDLLMEIIRALDGLHSGFSDKLQYDKLIPCRCKTCTLSPAPHFFPLGKLLERLSYRKETIECNNPPYSNVQIRGLIDDAVVQTTEWHGGNTYNITGDYVNNDKVGGDKIDGDKIAIDDISNSAVSIEQMA